MESIITIKTCFLLIVIQYSSANIYLKKLSTLYLPYTYENNTTKYGYDEKAAEQFAYDSENQIVYTVGDLLLLVIDVSNVSNPFILFHKAMPNTAMTDVETCGDFVIISKIDNLNNEHGIVEIYGKYNSKTKEMPLKRTVQVWKDPDMVVTTSDCKTILIALEAEAYPNMNASKLVDPPGGIGIMKFSSADLSQTPTYKTVNFSSFNNRWRELANKGARFINRDNDNTFGNDVEPESITLNADETIAYIALQENNAIAELNLKTETITNIYPLGYKDWRNHRLDVSDKDNKIDMRTWPVYGMYQPDIIQYFTVGGQEYIVSANEGDTKDYSDSLSDGFNEEVRVKDIIFDENSEVLKWAARNGFTSSTIKEDKYLGRLIVTNIEGRLNGTSKYNALYTFGARSFSIWRIDSTGIENVYDSGSAMEDKIKELRPDVFNADYEEKSYLLCATKDLLSVKKGPEPEMVTIGQYKGKTLVIVSAERPGMIFLYSIDSDVTKPKYESMWLGIPKVNDKTWEELYEERQISEIDPEDIRFIDETKSPNGKFLVMAIGTVSGTFSIFQIEDSGGPTGSATSLSSTLVWFITVISFCLSR